MSEGRKADEWLEKRQLMLDAGLPYVSLRPPFIPLTWRELLLPGKSIFILPTQEESNIVLNFKNPGSKVETALH